MTIPAWIDNLRVQILKTWSVPIQICKGITDQLTDFPKIKLYKQMFSQRSKSPGHFRY